MILTWNDVLHRVDVLRKICDGKAVLGFLAAAQSSPV